LLSQSRNERTHESISQLEGLQQPIHILKHIGEGRMVPEMLEMCNNDRELLEMWLEFIISMKWAENATGEDDDDDNNIIVITEKGMDALYKYYRP
jgi:hypothetical protein